MPVDKYYAPQTLTLGTASGTQALTPALATNGAYVAADSARVLPRSDPGTNFRWWISANGANAVTFAWAGASAGVQVDVQLLIVPTVTGGPSTHTGW